MWGNGQIEYYFKISTETLGVAQDNWLCSKVGCNALGMDCENLLIHRLHLLRRVEIHCFSTKRISFCFIVKSTTSFKVEGAYYSSQQNPTNNFI
jgi:hypothetical protein